MINGFATALNVVAQVASTTQTSADIEIPGRQQDGTGPLTRARCDIPKQLLMTIDVSAETDTPDLDIEVYIVDRASGTEAEIGSVDTIATVSKQIIAIGLGAIATPGHINAAIAASFGSIIRIKGVTDAGTGSPTITYTVGIEIAY